MTYLQCLGSTCSGFCCKCFSAAGAVPCAGRAAAKLKLPCTALKLLLATPALVKPVQERSS